MSPTPPKIHRVQRTNNPNPVQPSPLKTPKGICIEDGGLPTAIAKIYRHIFADGTIDQFRKDDIVILILNPAIKSGTVKRKSAGTLYDRTIVYMDTRTGKIEFKTPGSWGNISLSELKDALDESEKNRLI
ncbi:hypothetical protein LCGC14_0772680 [marine sediment metagenome]|uniref:Uncharacterized protein n=1 Tax=marine sediment metagenome TaxID=412755 RepID=A0A0F9QHN3_9ZZZZ